MELSVLGIDAAWTATEPSGVALVTGTPGNWRLRAVAPSYDTFHALSRGECVDWEGGRFAGAAPLVGALMETSRSLGSDLMPSVIAVDMPMAVEPFSTRRRADREVSRQYGGRGCSTHSPTSERPGPISWAFTAALAAAGYPLATASGTGGEQPRALEVYPHPALLHLLGCKKRLPYKVSRSGKYWKGATPAERRERLLEAFTRIRVGLARHIDGVEAGIPLPSSVETLSGLKRYEDALDAVICAWVGTTYLEGRATPLGDSSAAIWIPDGVVT